MHRLSALLFSLLLLTACERGTVRDIGASGTGEAPVNHSDGPAAALPNPDATPGGAVPEMQTDTNYNRTPRGAFVIEGTVRRGASGQWTLETERQPFQLVDLPAEFQRDGLRTKMRLEMLNADAVSADTRQVARVIAVGDVL